MINKILYNKLSVASNRNLDSLQDTVIFDIIGQTRSPYVDKYERLSTRKIFLDKYLSITK